MFIKRVHTRGVVYLQLVESYWKDGQSKHRVLKSLGREDELDPKEVDRLRASLKRYGSAEAGELSVDLDDVGLEPGRRVGALLPLQALWGELGLTEILSGLASGRRFSFDVATIVKAIVFQRMLSPGSERALVGSWLRSVYAPEFEGIELQHTYRALRFLAEVGPAARGAPDGRADRAAVRRRVAGAVRHHQHLLRGCGARRPGELRLLARQARRPPPGEPRALDQPGGHPAGPLALPRQAVGRAQHGRGQQGLPLEAPPWVVRGGRRPRHGERQQPAGAA